MSPNPPHPPRPLGRYGSLASVWGAMSTWPHPRLSVVSALATPGPKLLGSLGRIACLAAGHTPHGPLSRSAARYSIEGRGFAPRHGLSEGGGWSLGLAVSLTGRTSSRQAVVAMTIRRRLGRACGSELLWSCRGIGALPRSLSQVRGFGPASLGRCCGPARGNTALSLDGACLFVSC